MPQRHSCRSHHAGRSPWTLPNRNAHSNAVYTQEVNLYSDPEFKSNRGTAPLELRRFTVEWTAVNKYTQADGTVR